MEKYIFRFFGLAIHLGLSFGKAKATHLGLSLGKANHGSGEENDREPFKQTDDKGHEYYATERRRE